MNIYDFCETSKLPKSNIITTFDDLFNRFNKIAGMKHDFQVENDKDVGDFFESLLNKGVDNLQLPDLSEIETEIKTSSGKKKTTAFTKSPDDGYSVRQLVDRFGYEDKDGKLNKNNQIAKRLMVSVTGKPNNRGFYLDIQNDRLYLINKEEKLCSWRLDILMESFAGKMPNLAYVNYTKDKNGITFNTLTLYKNVQKIALIDMIKNGEVVVELRARHGFKDKNESYIRDRGTAFRLTNSNSYSKLFEDCVIG